MICKKDFEDNSFRSKVFNVKQKYNLLNRTNLSFFSQSQKSFDSENFKSNDNNLLNSKGICTLSTLFSPETTTNGNNILNFQKFFLKKPKKNYSSLFKYSKSKGHISHNLDLSFPKLKINDINNSPFASF